MPLRGELGGSPERTGSPHGEESEEAKVLEGCGKEGRPRHEEAQERYVEERPVRQKGEKPQAGDRDRPVGSPQVGRSRAEEGCKEERCKEEIEKAQQILTGHQSDRARSAAGQATIQSSSS